MLLAILILTVFVHVKKYKDYPLLDAEVEGKDYNTIDINYIGRVVVRATHVGK